MWVPLRLTYTRLLKPEQLSGKNSDNKLALPHPKRTNGVFWMNHLLISELQYFSWGIWHKLEYLLQWAKAYFPLVSGNYSSYNEVDNYRLNIFRHDKWKYIRRQFLLPIIRWYCRFNNRYGILIIRRWIKYQTFTIKSMCTNRIFHYLFLSLLTQVVNHS